MNDPESDMEWEGGCQGYNQHPPCDCDYKWDKYADEQYREEEDSDTRPSDGGEPG